MLFSKHQVVKRILWLTLLSMLTACNSSDSDSDDNGPINSVPIVNEPNPNLPPEDSVEGVWDTICFFNELETANSYQINTYIRRGADTFYRIRNYESRGCAEGFTKELLIVGITENIGSVVDPTFGVSATSVLVTVTSIFLNATVQSGVPERFFDLVYRSNENIYLGIPGTEDSETNIPQYLNWTLAHRYVDL